MQSVVLEETPTAHPALRLLEQVLGRAANPPVAQGAITLYVNGGRVTDIHPEYLLPEGASFELVRAPLSAAQLSAVQAVAYLLPKLSEARIDCRLVLEIVAGEPRLPVLFHGRYVVVYEPERDTNLRRTRSG